MNARTAPIFLICLILTAESVLAQKKDSTTLMYHSAGITKTTDSIPARTDSVRKKKIDPNKATLYSAVLPGLGQVYNHRIWKVPLVYAGLLIPAYYYFFNKEWYQKTAYALAVLVNGSYITSPDSLSKVDSRLLPFIYAGANNSLINYRNQFRKDQDYSLLFFLLFWGLNIVDATVDAHLRLFDVSGDLSLEIKPETAPGFGGGGVGIALNFHKAKPKLIDLSN
jgi:hypothetical protein